MYQNKNLFPFLAVLVAAGLIAGAAGLFVLIADRYGGSNRLAANPNARSLASQQLEGDDSNRSALERRIKTAGSSPVAPSTVMGAHNATVLRVATAYPDRQLVASGSYDNTVKLWNSSSKKLLRSLPHGGRVNDLAFIPGRQKLVTVSGAGNLRIWNTLSGQLQATAPGESGRMTSVAVASDGTTLATGSGKGTLRLWTLNKSAAEPRTKDILVDVGAQINALVFHPSDRDRLVSGDQDGVIRVWDLADKKELLTLSDAADRIVSLAISPDGRYVASGSRDQKIRVWDLASGDLVKTLESHDFVVADLAFSASGASLVSSSYDESIKTWDWQKGEVLCTLLGHSGFVYTVDFIGNSDRLISGGYDGTVRIWDLSEDNAQTCLAS